MVVSGDLAALTESRAPCCQQPHRRLANEKAPESRDDKQKARFVPVRRKALAPYPMQLLACRRCARFQHAHLQAK